MHWKKNKIILPPEIRSKLVYNVTSENYEITEFGVTYYLTTEQINDLKVYTREHRSHTVEAWYNHLDRFAKNKINKSGDKEPPEQYNDGDFIE